MNKTVDAKPQIGSSGQEAAAITQTIRFESIVALMTARAPSFPYGDEKSSLLVKLGAFVQTAVPQKPQITSLDSTIKGAVIQYCLLQSNQ